MGFDHRKLLLPNLLPKSFCNSVSCRDLQNKDGWYMEACCKSIPLSPPPPPPPYPLFEEGVRDSNQKHLITSLTIMACVIGGTLIFAILSAIIRVYYKRRSSPIFFGAQEDFVDEDHGPEMDHPIWYINMIGLQQSIIDSITVINYKKDEGLTEGTECAVCLNEFQEDENLRLLPKCSHAFHIPCIDTWLRSHKNCPLCRAPIVSGAIVGQATLPEPNPNHLSSRDESQAASLENYSVEGSNDVGEDGTSEERIRSESFGEDKSSTIADNSKKSLPHSKTICDSHSRVLSDLGNNHRVVEEPIRRSVSMDSSSASMIYSAVASIDKHQESLDTDQLMELKNSKSKIVVKRSSGSSSICKLMKSSSIGCSLQKGPVSMKRSFSSSRKLPSRSARSQGSVLPL